MSKWRKIAVNASSADENAAFVSSRRRRSCSGTRRAAIASCSACSPATDRSDRAVTRHSLVAALVEKREERARKRSRLPAEQFARRAPAIAPDKPVPPDRRYMPRSAADNPAPPDAAARWAKDPPRAPPVPARKTSDVRGEFAVRSPQRDALPVLQQKRERSRLVHQHLRVIAALDQFFGARHQRIDQFRHPLHCFASSAARRFPAAHAPSDRSAAARRRRTAPR